MSTSKEVILLVEDEEAIAEGLCFNFERSGFDVVWQSNGKDAIEYIQDNVQTVNLIVLDLMLPEVDGFSILKLTRELSGGIPIIVLSAKGLESDKVRALELGADDYVTKPFSLSELLLRIRGLIKRSNWLKETPAEASQNGVLAFGSGSFFRETLTFVAGSGQSVKLSPTEASLLHVFAANPNQILSRQQLLKEVWQYEPGTETRTVDVFVSKLRRVAEIDEKNPAYILSVRGAGYAYVTEEQTRKSLQSRRTK